MDKKYRVGIIGRTGHGDYGHEVDVTWLRIPTVEIVGVADDNPQGLAKAAERLKVERTFDDYRKMLDETKPDVVSVCTRYVDTHQAMILAAVQRGIHVFSEKPMCRSLAEADEIVRACEQTHAHVAIAHQTRYSPKLAVVRKLIADGKLGEVLEFRGRGKADQRGGGEDLWVLGSHIMDLIRTLGGDPQWCFASVTQAGQPIRRRDVVDGAEGLGPLAGDAVSAMYALPKGAMAYFSSQKSGGRSAARFALQIFGTEGVLEILTGYLPSVKFLADASWSPGRSRKAWQDVSSAGIGQPEPLTDGGLGQGNELAILDLLSSIEERREPVMNAGEARGAIEMIVACFESQRLGTPVPLPLASRDNPLTKLGD
jgi:predicted dehydrogenase